jgi:hypothetical protein
MLGVDSSCYYACLFYSRMKFEFSCVCVYSGICSFIPYDSEFETRGRVFFEGGESAMSTPIAVSLLILFLPLIKSSLCILI